MERLTCGDNSCILESPEDWGTNGGCLCLEDLARDEKLRVEKFIQKLRDEIDRLKKFIIGIQDNQNICSMCYEAIAYADGYYEEWTRQQMKKAQEQEQNNED